MRKHIILFAIMTHALIAQLVFLDQTWFEIDRAGADSIRDPVEAIITARNVAAIDSPWINPGYLPDEIFENRETNVLKPEFQLVEKRGYEGADSLGRPIYRVYYRNKKPALLEKIGYRDSKRAFMAYHPKKSRWWKCAK